MGILMLAGAITFMAGVAKYEGRSSFIWAMYTLFLCIVCRNVILIPFFDVLAAIGVSFLSMFLLKVMRA